MKQKDTSNTTRMAILDAANAIIIAKGVNAFTLDSVAQQAGVSKGGLLYHFPSKNKLIEGMIEYLIAEFDAMLEVELAQNKGDWLSAYIHASFRENSKLDRVGSALFAAVANDPDLLKPLQTHYAQWQEQASANAGSPELGTIIRMAVDGLWISDLLDFAPPDPAMRQKMLTVLLNLAGKDSL
jgi:AcrR family transcriptional regulator